MLPSGAKGPSIDVSRILLRHLAPTRPAAASPPSAGSFSARAQGCRRFSPPAADPFAVHRTGSCSVRCSGSAARLVTGVATTTAAPGWRAGGGCRSGRRVGARVEVEVSRRWEFSHSPSGRPRPARDDGQHPQASVCSDGLRISLKSITRATARDCPTLPVLSLPPHFLRRRGRHRRGYTCRESSPPSISIWEPTYEPIDGERAPGACRHRDGPPARDRGRHARNRCVQAWGHCRGVGGLDGARTVYPNAYPNGNPSGHVRAHPRPTPRFPDLHGRTRPDAGGRVSGP